MDVNTISCNDSHQSQPIVQRRTWTWQDRLRTRSAAVVQARVMSESSETASERFMRSVSKTGFWNRGRCRILFLQGKILDSGAQSFLARGGCSSLATRRSRRHNTRPEIVKNMPESRILARFSDSTGFRAYLQGSSPTSKIVKRTRFGF